MFDSAKRNRGGHLFWDTLRVDGDEVKGCATPSAMADSADAVVTGSFSDLRAN